MTNGISVYQIRELRLESLRVDGALVPLLELVEDIAEQAETGDLADLLGRVEEMKENDARHEEEAGDLFSATECSSIEEVIEAYRLTLEERDKADQRRDEQRDALHRLQDAVTKIARAQSVPETHDALVAAVLASGDGTPVGLRGTDERRRAQHETQLQALKTALDERDLAIAQRNACHGRIAELEAKLLAKLQDTKPRTRKRATP